MENYESPLFWPTYIKNNTLYALDETLIPAKVKYIPVKNTNQAVNLIRTMKTRAFGQFLIVLNTFLIELNRVKGLAPAKIVKRMEDSAKAFHSSRPRFPFADVTSIVLEWTHQGIKDKGGLVPYLVQRISGFLNDIRFQRLERVSKIAALIENGDSVLTHCNVSGELAMAAAICRKENKRVKFYATETRPDFQGARLTAWELNAVGALVTLVADNAVGSLMAERLVNRVIIGSDLTCANGDVANTIGSYQIAVLAKEFNVPVLVLTQPSDSIKKASDNSMELRDPDGLLIYKGRKIFSDNVKGYYPGFDIVPPELITDTFAIQAGAR